MTSSDFFRKSSEFQVWLSEQKGIPPDAPVPRGELNEHFKTYAEDYNTCTLPHEKYYDLEAWEKAQAAGAAVGAAAAAAARGGAMDLLADSDERKRASAVAKRRAEAEMMSLYRAHMDADKVADMKRRQELQLQMQYAFKSGNAKEADRINKILNPEAR